MKTQRQHFLGMALLTVMSFMSLPSLAEYYVSEVTLSPGQQTRIYLPDMYVEAMNRYGSGHPYNWLSDNSSVCTATTYRSRTYCSIYAKSVGTTKIHYHGEYYRNGVIYDYDCYWDVKVVSSGGEGDDTGDDTPTGDPNEPADKWGVSGNYDIKWYNKNQSTFEIATNRELAGLAYLVNNGYSDFTGKTIKITEDINLSGKSWSSIGYEKQFNGTFDGQGHVLGGLYIGRQNENQECFGFFGCLGSNSVVCNVTLQGEVNIVNPVYTDTKSGTHCVGGLAGACNSTTVQNCKCEMTVKYSRNVPNGGYVKDVYVGGMFGSCGEGVISYCSHEGDVSCVQTPSDAGYSDVASAYVGGLIGNYSGALWGNGILEYCENVSTTITCEVPTNSKSPTWTNVGGLYAKGYGQVEHCRNVCNFDITHHGFTNSSSSISVSIGGIGGESTATTIDCYSSVQKAVITSSRLNNVYYSGIGGHSNTSKANYSNSDVSIQTSRPLSRKYDGSTAFTYSQMQTPAFLEELNMYSILEGDGAVWTQDEGGFPYIASLHETSKVSKGDANGDGTVNAADIVEIVNYIMGSSSDGFKIEGADANGDGTVNAADIVAVANIIMGN